jgi:hypothetical protein
MMRKFEQVMVFADSVPAAMLAEPKHGSSYAEDFE